MKTPLPKSVPTGFPSIKFRPDYTNELLSECETQIISCNENYFRNGGKISRYAINPYLRGSIY